MTTSREELLRKWVDALESGKYEQARDTLRVSNSFCCLGVLCDLSDAGQWREIDHEADAYDSEDSTHFYVIRRDTLTETELSLPATLRFDLGLRPNLVTELQTLNDTGHTFGEIAERIRNEFPDVFVTVQPPRPLAGQRGGRP